MEDANFGKTLPFDRNPQYALLGHLFTNRDFFFQAKGLLKGSYWIDPYAGQAWELLVKYQTAVQTFIPTPQELVIYPEFTNLPQDRKNRIRDVLQKSIEFSKVYHLEALTPQLTEWLKHNVLSRSLDETAKLFNEKKLDKAITVIKQGIRDTDDVDFSPEVEFSFDDYPAYLEQRKNESYNNALTFGLTAVDRALLPHSQSGGFLPGDTTILLAPTNVGKTTCMITTIVANIKRGVPTLFITHEGPPEDIREKIWMCYLDCTRPELYQMHVVHPLVAGHTKLCAGPCRSEKSILDFRPAPDGGIRTWCKRCEMDVGVKFFTRFLKYIPMNKPGLTVERVEAEIRREMEVRATQYAGDSESPYYRLIVNDYPAKLVTEMGLKGNLQKRFMDEYVYNYFVQLALEFKAHSLLAIQTNRTGATVNNNQRGEERLLSMSDVAESWGPMTIATNVISLNRDEVAEYNERITYYICKSRSDRKGVAVVAKTAYPKAVTHSDKLGAAVYYGHSPMYDRIDNLLKEYLNKEIPQSELLKDTL